MSIQSLVDNFLSYLKYEKGYSDNTYNSYKIDLYQFVEWSNMQITEDLEIAHINNYLLKMKKRGLERKTINRKMSSLSSFISFLYKRGIIQTNFRLFMDFPRQNKRLPKTISKDSLRKLKNEKMIKYYKDNMIFLRDNVMLLLMYSCGLRVSEVVDLLIKNIDLNQKTIMILGKGEKERLLPLSDEVVKKIAKFLQEWDSVNREYLFAKKNGKKLTRQRVWEIIKYWKATLNITEEITPHMLRHTFATILLENNIDLRYIQEMLGHSNIATTEIYTSVNTNRLHEIYNKSHPRA
jgi:site-specific recombinase XerD